MKSINTCYAERYLENKKITKRVYFIDQQSQKLDIDTRVMMSTIIEKVLIYFARKFHFQNTSRHHVLNKSEMCVEMR
jgi:hypothetical protein